MDNASLVSVIIPVYNTESYLRKCVDSAINQTYKNIEIWLIDDGSTDSSHQICDEYEKMDSRIKVIHIENGGLSAARNVALDSANGEYIAFLDSDDWLSANWIESLYDSIRKNNSLISVGGICCCSAVRQQYIPVSEKEECILSPNQMIKYITESNIRPTVTNKLYHNSLFKNLRFPVGKINEDVYIIPELIGQSKKISFAKDCYYYIRIRDGSITHKAFSANSLDLLYASDNMIEYYMENYPKLKKLALAHRLNEISYMLNALFLSNKYKSYKDAEIQLRQTLIDTLKKYKNSNGEMFGYSVSNDIHLYLNNRAKYIIRCKKELINKNLRQFAIRIASVVKKKNY